MRKLVLLALTLSTMQCYSQDVDARLVTNKGDAAKKAYTYNTNAYNYMLFELDSSYVVIDKADLSKEEKQLIVKKHAITPEVEPRIGTPMFNLFSFGIQLSKTTRQYFELSEEKVLVVYSIPEISKAFKTSTLNTK